MTFSFKDKKEQIEIEIELENETLKNVKVNQLPMAVAKFKDGESVAEYYERILFSIFRKNENTKEIIEKITNELTSNEIAKLINQVREEISGKYLD